MKRFLPLGLFVLVATVKSCAPQDPYSKVHSDSGITGPAYSEILTELKSLESKFPNMTKLLLYGKTVSGRDMAMIRIGKKDVTGKKPAIFISGTIHGDEFLGIEDKLPRWFLENQESSGVAKFLAVGGAIFIVPIVNPDGYEADQRQNSRGQDLNRDFDFEKVSHDGFNHPETSLAFGPGGALDAELKTGSYDLKVTLDYHCCQGSLLYPWAYSETAQLSPEAKAQHTRLKDIILADMKYPSGRVFDLLNYTAKGGSLDYFHEKYGSASFVFEGAYGRENRNFDKHTKFWDKILEDQSKGFKQPSEPTEPTEPTEPGGSKLTMAIAKQVQNDLTLYVGADKEYKIDLCRGDRQKCGQDDAEIMTRYKKSKTVGSRIIFEPDQAVTVGEGEVFTIRATDPASGSVALESVSFKAK